jgi:hypothetical protein
MALKVLGVAIGGIAAALVAMSAGDIVRYMKLRSM